MYAYKSPYQFQKVFKCVNVMYQMSGVMGTAGENPYPITYNTSVIEATGQLNSASNIPVRPYFKQVLTKANSGPLPFYACNNKCVVLCVAWNRLPWHQSVVMYTIYNLGKGVGTL